jgi:hypothetical protein
LCGVLLLAGDSHSASETTSVTAENFDKYSGWSVEAEFSHSNVQVTVTVNVNPDSVVGESAYFTLYEKDLVVDRSGATGVQVREWGARLRLVTCPLEARAVNGRLQFYLEFHSSLLSRASVTFLVPEQSGMPAFSAAELILGELVDE